MTLVRFKGANHPQQVAKHGAREDVDARATDPAVFQLFHARFGFTIDVAATSANTKCERFFTKEQNGLALSWANERVWCNPPYSAIGDWVRKAWTEWSSDAPPRLIVMLLPANRTEQAWWQDFVEPFRDGGGDLRVEFIRGRTRFVRSDRRHIGPNERPPFGCCLCIWQRAPFPSDLLVQRTLPAAGGLS